MSLREYTAADQGPPPPDPKLPADFPHLPDDLVKRYPDIDDYHDQLDQFWRRVRRSVIDDTVASNNIATQTTAATTTASARADTLAARIDEEKQARVDGDTALASTISSIIASAGVGNDVFVQGTVPVAHSLNDIWYDTSNGFAVHIWDGTAWADATDARLPSAVAAITTETAARVTADTALATSVTTLAALVNTDNTSLLAAITTEATTRTTTDTALANSITTVAANLTTETNNRTTADTTLQTNITTISAAVTTEATARATADTAIAASVATVSASLTTESNNRLTGDNTLQTNVNTVSAAVTTEATARATADTALSSQVNTISATLNSVADVYSLVLTNTTIPAFGSVQKNAGASAYDAQAYSNESYVNGAYLEFKAAQTNKSLYVGLNTDPATDAGFASIDYAWQADATANSYVSESGTPKAGPFAYSASTVFSVVYDGISVRYFMDGILKYTSAAAGNIRLYLDSSIKDVNAQFNSLRFGPSNPATFNSAALINTESTARAAADSALATQINTVSVTLTNVADVYTLVCGGTVQDLGGGTIKKVGGASAFDSGAYTVDGYTGGAYCSFTAGQTGLDMAAGLNTDPATDNDYASIDYSWVCNNADVAYIFESGVNISSFGAFTTSTVFSITYDGSFVRYYMDGALKRQTVAAPALKFYFDSSILAPGAIMNDIRFGPADPSMFNSATQFNQLSASITTEAVARAAADGSIEAMWGVEVDVNGHISGRINLDGTNASSTFLIAVDKFQVVNANGTVTAFDIRTGGAIVMGADVQSDNFVAGATGWRIERLTGDAEFHNATIRGTLNADDIAAGTINVSRLPAGTVNVTGSSGGSQTLLISGTTATTISLSVTTAAIINIQAFGSFTNNGGTNSTFAVLLYMDGSPISGANWNSNGNINSGASQSFSIFATPTIAAGAHVFKFYITGFPESVTIAGTITIQ